MSVQTRPGPAAPTSNRPRRLRWLFPALGLILWLIIGGPLAGLAGKTSEVQKNDNASYLPETAESTVVLQLDKQFAGQETAPGIIVFVRDGGLTDADKATIQRQLSEAADHLGDKLAAPPIGPVYSEDGQAAQAIIQFA